MKTAAKPRVSRPKSRSYNSACKEYRDELQRMFMNVRKKCKNCIFKKEHGPESSLLSSKLFFTIVLAVPSIRYRQREIK
jgi:hypothetical protein